MRGMEGSNPFGAGSLARLTDRSYEPRATAMNESVYTGAIRFNASVYGYVLSAAIIYKQRVKVLSGVECLYTGEKEPYRYLEPSRDLLERERRGKKGSGLFCPVYRREKCYRRNFNSD